MTPTNRLKLFHPLCVSWFGRMSSPLIIKNIFNFPYLSNLPKIRYRKITYCDLMHIVLKIQLSYCYSSSTFLSSSTDKTDTRQLSDYQNHQTTHSFNHSKFIWFLTMFVCNCCFWLPASTFKGGSSTTGQIGKIRFTLESRLVPVFGGNSKPNQTSPFCSTLYTSLCL